MKNTIKGLILFSIISLVFASCADEPAVTPNDNTNNNNNNNNASLATVQTVEARYIKSTSAFGGGKIIKDGGADVTMRGICWSELPEPNINNDKTDDGTGTGNFLTEITGLKQNTKYYVRAYAVNSVGVAYGNEITFNTAELDLEAILHNGSSLYVAPSSSAEMEWGPSTASGVNSATDGQANTEALSKLPDNYAAKVCADLDAWGYDDWYLPSQSELAAIKQQVDLLSGWAADDENAYWSSTEKDANTAYAETFSQHSNLKEYPKTVKLNCRCIRKDE